MSTEVFNSTIVILFYGTFSFNRRMTIQGNRLLVGGYLSLMKIRPKYLRRSQGNLFVIFFYPGVDKNVFYPV